MSQLPRLTRAQYDKTIQDLLGLGGEPSSMLAPDSTGSVDKRAWDGYRTAAATLAAGVIADANSRAVVIPCTPAGDGTECARQLIMSFGQRAFRRPLVEEEIARFEALYAGRAELTESGTFDEGVELIVEAFLVSPSFLTRAEIAETVEGELIVLSPYEVASRLSYMLWGSMPDQALFDAAAANALSTPAQILAQADRMLADPKARTMVAAFHQSYLHMGPGTRWADISRDPSIYPAFNEGLVPLLSAETDRFLDFTVFDQGGTFQDLMTSRVAFVNAELAPIYGLDPAQFGPDLTQVDLDPTTRSGLLTRAGFLTAESLYDRSSPILRGAFIQKEILCAPIGVPPPDAEGTPLPTEGLQTNRERVDAQTAAAACAGCHHQYINPTGFALEAYDGIGAYQTTESFSGAPIDTAASVYIGEALVDVTGPIDLSEKIAASVEAQRCYARKWVEHAYQRAINSADSCTVDNLTSKLTQGGYTVLDLITDLTQSETFRYRAIPTEAAP